MPAERLRLSNIKMPKLYKVAIQQGNVITQEMVDKLKPGMTRRQVAFVMGEPVLRDPLMIRNGCICTPSTSRGVY